MSSRMKFNWLVFALVLLVIPLASASILDPNEGKTGNYAGTTLNSSYDELVGAWFNPVSNVTSVIGGRLWVPWFSGDNVCTNSSLQSGGNCGIGTVNLTVNCMVSDEFSQVGVGLALGLNQTRFDQYFEMVKVINSTRGTVPSWKVVRNGTTLYACHPNANSNCDTASDATARFIISLYTAANNTVFSATNRTAYRTLANTMTADMLTYEIDRTSRGSGLGHGNISYWMAAGAVAQASGLGATDYGYSGYYQDGAIAFLAAYRSTGNATYLNVAKNISLNYFQAARFNGSGFTVPPGRSFKWENITGTPFANCTNTCNPDQWDSADAPRAFGLGQLQYYSNISRTSIPLLSAYMDLWRIRHMQANTSVALQYYSNGTASASNQSGYFAQGLESLALSGVAFDAFNISYFNATLRSALGHYQSSSQTMDGAACFGVYGQAFSIRSLGMAIGRDDNSFSAQALDTTNPNATLIAPSDGSSGNLSSFSFNATFGDDTSLANATLYIWNSTGALINTTTRALSGFTGGANVSVNLSQGPGTYTWNYRVVDNSSNFAFAITNFTVTYALTPPAPNPETYVCTGGDRGALSLILVGGVLLMLLPLLFIFSRGGVSGIFDMSLQELLISFIVIVAGSAFIVTSARNIGAVCGT